MIVCVCLYVVFFFKQKTAYEMRISDWSSDVCSSDLEPNAERRLGHYSEGIPSIEPLQSRFHAAASKRIGAVLKSSLMLSDRKSVVEGKSVSVRVDLGGRRVIKKKK